MLEQLPALVGQLVESALLVVGIRAGTEEPPYRVEPLVDGVEIRRYGPRIAAETTVLADEDAARRVGFRRLAGYIFGANNQAEKVAMTAPVGQLPDRGGGQKIAMTAPAAQSGDPEQGWIIRFYMPANWTMDTLPAPLDSRVHLVELPAETVAVLRFSGGSGSADVAARSAQLHQILRTFGFEPDGEPTAWFYDPPWTIPCRRRNEVSVPVGEDPGRSAR